MKYSLLLSGIIRSASSSFLLSKSSCFKRDIFPPYRSAHTIVKDATSAEENARLVQNILFRVRDVNYMPDDIRTSLLEVRVNGAVVGKVRPGMAELLCSDPSAVFKIKTSSVDSRETSYLCLNNQVSGTTCASRSAAVAHVMERLRGSGIVPGWRNEQYPISTSFYAPPLFLMERAAVPLLGGIEYGVHVNGLVECPGDETKMWMARRSATKLKYPGMLDHIVAGGQPAGIGLMDNVIKECLEEANIPEHITRAGIKPVGAISYETFSPKTDTVARAVIFTYDLYLPPEFQPTPVDGEVQAFFQWSMSQVLQSMDKDYPDPIKPNCYSVIIDYLLREQGHLVSPETPGYLDVLRELRSGDCR